MTTVAELIEELQRWPRHARVTVLIDTAVAGTVTAGKEDGNFFLDDVEPIGCNVFDIQLTVTCHEL